MRPMSRTRPCSRCQKRDTLVQTPISSLEAGADTVLPLELYFEEDEVIVFVP